MRKMKNIVLFGLASFPTGKENFHNEHRRHGAKMNLDQGEKLDYNVCAPFHDICALTFIASYRV